MRVVVVDGGCLDDVARAGAVWGAAKDEGVGGRVGDVRSASSGRTTFWRLCVRGLSEDAVRNEESGDEGCSGSQAH